MTRSYLPLLLPTISLLSSAIPPTSAAPGNGEWRFGSFLGGWGDGAPSTSSSGSTSALAEGASSKNAANGPSGTTNNASVYAPGDVQVVVVGGEAGLVYSPSIITASVGSKVFFEFQSKNHTVTQSTFDSPCTPLDAGFSSGFLFSTLGGNSSTSTSGPGFVLEVTDDQPIWFYCAQTLPVNHCEAGMVGAINPPTEGNTYESFLANALALGSASGSANGSGTNSSIPPTNATFSQPSITDSAYPAPTSSTSDSGGWNGTSTGSGNVTTVSGFGSKCNLTDIGLTFPEGSNLTIPEGAVVDYVALGGGTQNYTCTSGKYTSIGAVAGLVDVSCLVDASYFLDLPAVALILGQAYDSNGNLNLTSEVNQTLSAYSPDAVTALQVLLNSDNWMQYYLGLHSFTFFPEGATKASPEFIFPQEDGTVSAQDYVIGNLTASYPDPVDSKANINWLQLSAIDGQLATGVYRIVTAGGVPPASCDTEGEELDVDYAAFYVFTS